MEKLTVLTNNNERVLTTKQMACVYETEEVRIRQALQRNQERFEKGKHYYKLEGEELKYFKRKYLKDTSLRINSLILWTEKGANRMCKILDTDRAWEQFDILEETYFRVKENNKPQLPGDYLTALKALVASEEEKQKLQIENKEQKEVLNTFETAKGNILVRELAKIMSKEGISIGEKRLWEKLREWKLVNSKNEPYQKYIDMGVFELKEGVKNNHTYRTLKITGKGQVYIINKFKNN